MKHKSLLRCFIALALCAAAPTWLHADDTEDEKAIRAAGEAYVAPFNTGDAKAIAALWSANGVYADPATGEEVTGREAIAQQMAEAFEALKDAKLEIDVEEIRILSPNVAVEKGVARVLAPGMEPDETVYTALYVKSERGWLLDRINESAPQVVLSNYEQLKDLEWMVGTWVDQDDEATIETSVKWTKNQNFLSRSFRVSVPGEPDLSGIQLIGWDPANQEIRSWVFDSDGGFGNATWKKKDNKWIVNAAATLPDGRKSSAVRIITMVDDNTVTWQVTGRSLDGEILPNISPIKLTRNSNSE